MDENIGKIFTSWRLDSKVSDVGIKKYNYNCTCIGCGEKKQFMIYKLENGNYAACKKCGHLYVKNLDEIKKMWNAELNGCVFTSAEDFNLSRRHWFMCENGHNFKSNLKDFSKDHCFGCKESLKSNHLRHSTILMAEKLAKKVLKDVLIESDFIIMKEINLAILIIEKDRFDNCKNYYNNEDEFINDILSIKQKKIELEHLGITTKEIYFDYDTTSVLDTVGLSIKERLD